GAGRRVRLGEGGGGGRGRGRRLRQPDRQQLARVVPLVERLRRGQALVALEPQQRRSQCLGQRLARLGLAHPRLAFQEDGLPHPRGQEQRRPECLVRQVSGGVERVLQRRHVRNPFRQITHPWSTS